jgi:AAA family ATP:ADP antiporter
VGPLEPEQSSRGNLNSPIARLVRWITGAEPQEAASVLFCFMALLMLLVSYYLIKPLRNSLFLKEFDPDLLPVATFVVVLLSFLVTKIFNYLADRVEKYRLVTGAYLAVVVIKLAFTWLLSIGGKAVVLTFYFFASVYFLLAIATMWACANDIFRPEQGERCFGFIAVGSTLGSIAGSKLSSMLLRSPFKDYAPTASAICMALALGLILLAARGRQRSRSRLETLGSAQTPPSPPPSAFWSDVREILVRPYVRRIGTMVLVLAIFSSSLDYISQAALDDVITREQYTATFSYLPAEAYSQVYALKAQNETERAASLAALAQQANLPVQRLTDDYGEYRERSENMTRQFFSEVSYWQGVLGIVLLLVVVRLIFNFFGVRQATVVLPLVAAGSLIAFAFPLGLMAIQWVIVISGAVNYSLNNAAKEVLYTASDEDTKFKYKPLIEGPSMRLGDVSAATLFLLLKQLSQAMGWSDETRLHLLLGLVLLLVLGWLRAAYLAGLEYDTVRRKMDQSPVHPTLPS